MELRINCDERYVFNSGVPTWKTSGWPFGVESLRKAFCGEMIGKHGWEVPRQSKTQSLQEAARARKKSW